MRINEFYNPILALLHGNMLLSEAPIGTATLDRTWNSKELGGKPDESFKPLGKIGRFTIGVDSSWGGVTNVLVVDRKNEIVGKLELLATEPANKDVTFWGVFKAILRRDLQGRGIMPKVYAFIINHGYILHADSEQSAGGQNTWAKLAKDPTVNVYAALRDRQTGEIEYSDVEGITQLQANFYLYHDEMREELKYIENEIEAVRDIRDRVNNEYSDVDPDDKDAVQRISNEYDRLTDQIHELELDYSELNRQHREESKKDLYLLAIPAGKSIPVNEDDDDNDELNREHQSDLKMVQIDGMNIMYIHNPRESVQLAAVKQNPYAIYEIDNLKSKIVILTAILGLLKKDAVINAKRLTVEFKKKYPDWPEWETITRSLKAIQ